MTSVQLFRVLRQALSACQLYPVDSPARDEATDRLWQALAAQTAPEGISFAFTEEGAYVDGQPVGEQEDAGVPMGRRLFELGLGELRFLPGIGRSEVRRLLDLLHGATQGLFNPVDEDLSILLWESELAHVTYWLYGEERWWEGDLASDPNAPDPLADLDAHLHADLEQHAGEFVSRRDLAFDVGQGDPSAHPGTAALSRVPAAYRGTPLMDYLDEEMRPTSEMPILSSCRLSEEERLRILAAHRQEVAVEIPWKYGLLLVEVLELEEDPEDAARIRDLLLAYLQALLDSDRFSMLRRLSQALRGAPIVRRAAQEPPEGRRPSAAADEVLSWFDRPEVLARLVSRLTAGNPSIDPTTSSALAEEEREAASAWFLAAPGERLLDCVGAPTRAPESTPDENPYPLRALRPLLDRRLAADAVFLDLVLARGPRSLLLRVLESLAESGGEVTAERARRIRELARAGAVDLRERSLRALGAASDGASLGLLADALNDPTPGLAAIAAESLARRGAHGLEPLLRVIAMREFQHRSSDEQCAFLTAAGRAGPREVWPVLARMAEARTFWPPGAIPARARLALDALAALGPEAREFAESRWAGKRRDLARRLASLGPVQSLETKRVA